MVLKCDGQDMTQRLKTKLLTNTLLISNLPVPKHKSMKGVRCDDGKLELFTYCSRQRICSQTGDVEFEHIGQAQYIEILIEYPMSIMIDDTCVTIVKESMIKIGLTGDQVLMMACDLGLVESKQVDFLFANLTS
ncbi:hypothetical protein ACOME3_000359 [Neoechinorhynchus agilis]